MEAKQTSSRLLSLPGELRTYIYEIVLETSNESEIMIFERTLSPPLLSTCKTIRLEASPIYYARKSFILPEGTCIAWIRAHKSHVQKYMHHVKLNATELYSTSKGLRIIKYKKAKVEAMSKRIAEEVGRVVIVSDAMLE